MRMSSHAESMHQPIPLFFLFYFVYVSDKHDSGYISNITVRKLSWILTLYHSPSFKTTY
jgi:hypothetical protein